MEDNGLQEAHAGGEDEQELDTVQSRFLFQLPRLQGVRPRPPERNWIGVGQVPLAVRSLHAWRVRRHSSVAIPRTHYSVHPRPER